MIRSIKVELNAAFPNMPLLPFHVFHGSAAAITVLNVPRRIVSLSVKVKNVSAVDRVFPAQRSGSAWVAVIPGSFFEHSGTSTRGVKIDGVDEAGNIYTLGAADLVVMLDNGSVEPVSPTPSVLGKLPLRALPKYLHFLAFDDTYPADAAWLYAQLGPSDMGRCSAVRRGGKLYRKYDWTFDFAPEFVVTVSGNATRFASTGIASVGSRLTENDVMSAVNSRYYKCLPGMTLDGINEKGVVCEINVDGGPKTGWHGDAEDEGIHILAAVRWVLDHGETAAEAAEWLADHIIQPQVEMNFHFMVADATSTYIVENGEAHDVTDGTKVLTNYALYDEAHAGGGKERYTLLAGGADISAVNFTNAYQSGNDWDSDFESAEQHAEAIRQWAAQGTDKEAHRGKTTSSGKAWWQSVHTTEYDFAAKTMKVAVQEVDDWYTFAVDQANVDLAPIEAQIAELRSGKRDKTDISYGDMHFKPEYLPLSGMDWLDHPSLSLAHDKTYYSILDDLDSEVGKVSITGILIWCDPDILFNGIPGESLFGTEVAKGDAIALASQLPSASQLLTQEQRDEIAKVKDKADEVKGWLFSDGVDRTLYRNRATNSYFWNDTDPDWDGSTEPGYGWFWAETEDENPEVITLTKHPSGEGIYITATRRRVLRTGDAATPQELTNAISTNNPAFVSAVRNTPTSGMPEDMPTDWGTYGTVGAALAALAAFVKWAKAKIVAIIGDDGKPTDQFATDLLGKQVAKDAVNALIDAKVGDVNAVLSAALDGSEVA